MLKKCILGFVAATVSLSAYAGGIEHAPIASAKHMQPASNGLYVGLQAGYVEHDGFNRLSKPGSAMNNDRLALYSKEQGSIGARLFAGYLLNSFVGLELGAGTYGSQKLTQANLKVGLSAKNTPYNVRTSAQFGVDADIVGRLPLSDAWAVFAKAGIAAVNFKTKGIDGNALDNAGREKVTHWNWMPRAELGFSYAITQKIAVTATYAYYFGINGSKTLEANPNTSKTDYSKLSPSFGLAAIGLVYSF